MIGIISYLPNEAHARFIRRKAHIRQLKELVNIFRREDIIIVAQNYRENEFVNYSRIKYIRFDHGIGPAEARNVLLKKFYDSQDECLLLMDDDVLWYDYYDACSLVVDFYKNSSKYDFDLLIPTDPMREPFKKRLFNKETEKSFLLKRIGLTDCPNIMLLKKVGLLQDGFDRKDPGAVNEDIRFLAEFITHGFKGYKCLHWIKKTYSNACCSIIESTSERESLAWHKMLVKNSERFIIEKYGVSMRDFSKRFNKADKERTINRIQPYRIQAELIPKEYRKAPIKE